MLWIIFPNLGFMQKKKTKKNSALQKLYNRCLRASPGCNWWSFYSVSTMHLSPIPNTRLFFTIILYILYIIFSFFYFSFSYIHKYFYFTLFFSLFILILFFYLIFIFQVIFFFFLLLGDIKSIWWIQDCCKVVEKPQANSSNANKRIFYFFFLILCSTICWSIIWQYSCDSTRCGHEYLNLIKTPRNPRSIRLIFYF